MASISFVFKDREFSGYAISIEVDAPLLPFLSKIRRDTVRFKERRSISRAWIHYNYGCFADLIANSSAISLKTFLNKFIIIIIIYYNSDSINF